jgi:hypothetical protein
MRGLLADANVQGHLPYLHNLLKVLELWPLLVELNLQVATFPDLDLAPELDDRSLWNFCQVGGWVLLMDKKTIIGFESRRVRATLIELRVHRPPPHLPCPERRPPDPRR